MNLASNYEISRTAHFIKTRGFKRVALQFPDELLKESTRVVSALRQELQSLRQTDGGDGDEVASLFVMADTTYGSCCVDEVGASHVDADCVIHYGHTCLSPTSTLPALFVFGKASIRVSDCVNSLSTCLSTSDKSILVLYGLEYAHVMPNIIEAMTREASTLVGVKSNLVIYYANVLRSVMDPSDACKALNVQVGSDISLTVGSSSDCEQIGSCVGGNRYSIGGLTWNLPEGDKMEEYMIYWIGSDNTAFANVVLTFNSSEIVRYDPTENDLVKDFSYQKKLLMRRYYLVEKAKDANIIGILVGTLGVAGYLNMIHQMKELITKVGKKAYILVMGRPNPAKLANFPECDVFIYVSCAQTALLDSKEFLAPVITPFEATLAFNRGSQWNGSYEMEFQNLIASSSLEVSNNSEEPRFSFLQGGYIEDVELQVTAIDLAETTQKALQLRDKSPNTLVRGTAKSGAEFFSSRSYHGLVSQKEDSLPRPVVMGRTGKASCYQNEKTEQGSL